jgi:hypothetical protein
MAADGRPDEMSTRAIIDKYTGIVVYRTILVATMTLIVKKVEEREKVRRWR